MSTMGNRVKKFYDGKLWTLQQVRDVTGVGAITPEEYKIITDEDYVA